MANYLPLEAEHSSQEDPHITVSKQMTNHHKQQIKFFSFKRVTSLTGNTILSDLEFFYVCNYIVDGSRACGVSSKMDVTPLHGAKRHEMGDDLFMEGKGVRSALIRVVIEARCWCAIGLVIEVGDILVGHDI